MGAEPPPVDRFEPRVRRADPSDREQLLRLAAAAHDHLTSHRGGEVFRDREARPEPSADSFDSDLQAAATGSALVLVGCLGPVPVGFAVVRLEHTRSASLAVVSELFVEPEARRVGVGRALMETVVEWARDAGCRGIDAEALPGDRATKNFFEAFGLVARKITVHRPLRDRSPGPADA